MLKKLVNWAKYMYDGFKNDKEFSVELARVRLKGTIASRLRLNGVAEHARVKKNSIIVSILSQQLQNEIQSVKKSQDRGEHIPNAPIWVCWWSGIETAPELVKKCIESITSAAGVHPIHMIDEKNYREYLEIPQYIIDKVEKKEMCLAHFSDYLRFSLLNQYGGMWIDATVYCDKMIPDNFFQSPLFTCNAKTGTKFISNGKWTTFIFCGNKGHALFAYLQKALETYWEKCNSSIDYLMLDYLIYIGYVNSELVRQDIDGIPVNNLHRNDLRAAMNRRESGGRLKEYAFPDTYFHKLSWREHYSLTDRNGGESIYAAFLRGNKA